LPRAQGVDGLLNCLRLQSLRLRIFSPFTHALPPRSCEG
jgi:hypothetical protein